ncbi:penicillin acylase family protein [Niabella terrae]
MLLVAVLNGPIGSKIPMPLGSFLSPQTGFWQNAEDTAADFSQQLLIPVLKNQVKVYLDERLVPHVFAESDEDLYFVQGYLHARFRLFQMDIQTRAAEGRASEVAGPMAIAYDKEQRRLGMKFAAENTLAEIEKNPAALHLYSAYTKGVNAYIQTLTRSQLPLEYKLLNFEPELWTNLKTCLLLKMMARMLSSGTEHDLAYSNLKSILRPDQLDILYPQVPDSLYPIIPEGTIFARPAQRAQPPQGADTAYFNYSDSRITAASGYREDPSNGSNNWVVAGAKTASGFPILCNDPHLELSLPSIWYEMQLSTPRSSCYGVTIPGSPFVIIGFNRDIAWGVTNAQRDVKDYYRIRFRDSSRSAYWFDGAYRPAQQRIERIEVKGGDPVLDTVSYTVFGPVMYDQAFEDTVNHQTALAVKWVAHHTGDDGYTFYKLNQAKNYNDYLTAIKTFECPGQNFVFASRNGDIAIWQQGLFPDRWKDQGLYVMPGEDSSYLWQGFIPQEENPHALNPNRNFLESANQRPADASYPYFIPGTYITPRATAIEGFLSRMNSITVQDMMTLQNNYFNPLARDMLSVLLPHTKRSELSTAARKYYDIISGWDFNADPASNGQTVYQLWTDSLQRNIWWDDLNPAGPTTPLPNEQTLMELLKRDSTASGFMDDRRTPETETLSEIVTLSLNQAATALDGFDQQGHLEWSKLKDVTVYHILKSLLPFARQGLPVGGSGNVINAVKKSHGPSWRMIVQVAGEPEAYGVYPGGQNGNAGSRFYDSGVDNWAAGKYYKLWMMKKEQATDPRVKWRMDFIPD